MAEKQEKPESDETNRISPSPNQSSPWYLRRDSSSNSLALNLQQREQLNNVFRSTQQHRMDDTVVGIARPMLPGDTTYPSEISDDIATSAARPGTPALPDTNFGSTFRDVSPQVADVGDLSGRGMSGRTSSAASRVQQNWVSVDAYQKQLKQPCPTPPPLCSLLAAQLPGNVARSFDELALEQQHCLPGLPYGPSNVSYRNMQQSGGNDRIRQVYQLGPVQQPYTFSPMSDVERSPNHYNFNQLQQNMVRLKNGGDPEHRINPSSSPQSDTYLQDDEGNHDCHDLRHGTNHERNGDIGQSSSIPASQLPGCISTILSGDANDLASFDPTLCQGEWPMHRALWMSGPSSIGEKNSLSGLVRDDSESIMSFSSSTAIASARYSHAHQLGTKVEMVYSLLSMLGSSNREDMSKTLLEMSSNRESCIAMRQSGCLPLLVQLLHGTDHDCLSEDQDPNALRWALREARRRAGQALHNIVYAHPDDKRGRREARVLRLLEQIRDYSDYLKDIGAGTSDVSKNENLEFHPGPAIAALMKLSFDEEHRHAMCLLGGLQAIAELIQVDHEVHGNTSDQFCITVRRYAGMALTNLTFGDGTNKALLCSMKNFMQALVAQLHSSNEDLRQVTASVLRNLSWRADASSKQTLREVDAVVTLMKTAMETSKESTLKSILSALWNLSAHCSVNKADICAIEGALEFLVSTLTYKSASKTLSIVENGGGILRNISSHIAVREDYRTILRKHNCLQTLLRHLKSPSLTVVSNACGTLWNLSARCQQDQQALWEMGAVGMLRNLIHSKHKMISMGSAAALKNLLAARPPGMGIGLGGYLDSSQHQNSSSSQNSSPSLLVRKQRALEADIDQNLSETCDNIDSPKTSPTPINGKKFIFDSNGVNKPQYLSYLPGRMYHSINGHVTSPLFVPRSESRDSVGSTRSEPPHYKTQCERFRIFVNTTKHWPLDMRTVHEKPHEWKEKTNLGGDDDANIVMQLFKSLHGNANALNVVKEVQDSRDPSCFTHSRETDMNCLKVGALDHSIAEKNYKEIKNVRSENGNIGNEKTAYSVHAADEKAAPNPSGSNDIFPVQKQKLSDDGYERNSEMNHLFFEKKQKAKDGNISYVASHDGLSIYQHLNLSRFSDEGSEDGRIHKFSMDPIHENVVLRKKQKSDSTRRSSTLRDSESEETSANQTPLAVSWCSSFSSVASCMAPSARNSWISDNSSRRTSGILSPSEIPDSPPSEMKPHVSRFTDKAPDAESLGIPRPRPAWPSHSSSSLKNEFPSNEYQTEEAVSGLPNNSCSTTQHNNSKLHSRVNSLSSSFSRIPSGIPVKSNNVRLTQTVLNVPRPHVLSSCAVGPSVLTGSSSDTPCPTGSEKQSHVCDDNDNLLIQDQECSINHDDNEPSKILTAHHGKEFKQFRGGTGDSAHKTFSYNADISSRAHDKEPKEIQQEKDNYLALTTTPSGSKADDQNISSDSSKNTRQARTSIPQMIRPWQLTVDSEAHPKQFQIISQNLPAYKSAFSIHQNGKCERKDDAAKPGEGSGHSEHSSVSADSEVSSSEKLQSATGKQMRAKTKRNKLFRRSAEITISGHSSDEDKTDYDEKNPSENHFLVKTNKDTKDNHFVGDKNKEVLLMGNAIPDLLEGAACHADIFAKKTLDGLQGLNGGIKNNGSVKTMSESMEIRKGAFMIAAELDEVADEHTHSSASCFSDLDNIKPPSVMGEMSMTSSGLSDLLSNGNGNGKCYLNGKAAADRRRSLKRIKKTNGTHRFVFKSVLQPRELARSSEGADKQCAGAGSIENLSMKSSGTSELLDNVNPPSIMDDISMTNSCASLNSINSDILESRSQSLADPRSDSEMFQRLNAAAAMVQVYSRELTNIMTGSMKSSYNSDNLDQVKPPSVFQDIAEVTVEDGTEVGSDAMMSDSELEEELPHDDEGSIPSTETVHSPLHLLTRTEHIEGSSDNLNSSFEGDSICNTEKHHNVKRVSNLALSSQNISLIDMDSNTVQHTTRSLVRTDSMNKSTNETCVMDKLNDATNEKSSEITSVPVRRGPRIVKPINRDTIRQMQEKKNQEKPVRSIRGKASTSRSSQRPAGFRSSSTCKPNSTVKKVPTVSTVRPTRTSALRASQSQKQADSRAGGSASPRSFLSKPPVCRSVPRNVKAPSTLSGADEKPTSNEKCQISEVPRPSPPVKQGTFTKDEPAQKVPEMLQQGNEKENCVPGTCMTQSQTYSMLSVQADKQEDSSVNKANDFEKPLLTVVASTKVNDDKSDLKFVVKRSTSNYGIEKNGALPLQRRENVKLNLKPSPSTQSFGSGEKSPGCSNPKSGNFSRNSLSSLSSSSLSLKRANSQKEVASKISSIWKKSDSSSSANSPVTDNSFAEKSTSITNRTRSLSSKTTIANRSHATTVSQVNSMHSPGCERGKPDVNPNGKKTASVKSHSSSSQSNGACLTPSYSRKRATVTHPFNQARVANNSSKIRSYPRSPPTKSMQPNILSQKNTVKPYKTTHPLSPELEMAAQTTTSQSKDKPSTISDLKTSPVSAVVTPFNYTPSSCKQSKACDDQNCNTTSVEETVDGEDSENSESVSGSGKKCLVTMYKCNYVPE